MSVPSFVNVHRKGRPLMRSSSLHVVPRETPRTACQRLFCREHSRNVVLAAYAVTTSLLPRRSVRPSYFRLRFWLWSSMQAERLSRRVARILADTQNELWLSPISIWELTLLCQKGRL